MNKSRTDTETAASAYIRQHVTIVTALEHLQAALDQMLDPTDNEITWPDVAEFAHVAEAAAALIERVRS